MGRTSSSSRFGIRFVAAAAFAVATSCTDRDAASRTSATARSATSQLPTVEAPPSAVLPAPTASASSATPPRANFPRRAKPSALAGFEVYESDGVVVALKRYYVDNVHDKMDGAFPPCPTPERIAKKNTTVESSDAPTAIVFQRGDRFGAFATKTYEERGDYGMNHVCCFAGDEIAAAALEPTLERAMAFRGRDMCVALLEKFQSR